MTRLGAITLTATILLSVMFVISFVAAIGLHKKNLIHQQLHPIVYIAL